MAPTSRQKPLLAVFFVSIYEPASVAHERMVSRILNRGSFINPVGSGYLNDGDEFVGDAAR
jgi:hypothetical protein